MLIALSEVPDQIHPRIQFRHLIGVAVEREGRPLEQLADAALSRLAPARVIHRGVHIAIETVFVTRDFIPRGPRLGLGEADPDDGLATLESVLPWHHEADRCAVLVGQWFAVQPGGEDREGMHRLVETERLDVRPRQYPAALAGHLGGIKQRGELDKPGPRSRLHPRHEILEGKAEPGDHHAPPFDAAVEDLFTTVRCRRTAVELGFEKLFLKNNTLKCFFVSNPDSPYFQSEIFNGILLFLQNGTNKGKLKQVGKNGILVVESIPSMNELFSFLTAMHNAAVK